MRLARIGRMILAALWALPVGCSLIVETSEIDGGCGPGRKVCDGRCVPANAPKFGCSPVSEDCRPCAQPTNALVDCVDNQCTVIGCWSPFIGCDDPLTSCDVEPLLDPENCGGCGLRCDPGERCSNGECCAADGQCHPGVPAQG